MQMSVMSVTAPSSSSVSSTSSTNNSEDESEDSGEKKKKKRQKGKKYKKYKKEETELKSVISFFNRRGPDLLSKFHGETEQNLRSLFQRAQECAPSIIFFDEIDGLCPIRSHKHEQVHNSVVATLLSLMDGLDVRGPEHARVFVIAATNRIGICTIIVYR